MDVKQAHVREFELAEAISYLPQVEPWSDDSLQVESKAIFICALGFEDRALAIPERLVAKNVDLETAFICEYATNLGDNEKNRPRLERPLRKISSQVITLKADEPESLAKHIETYLAQSNNQKLEVIFDISAASGNLILSVMHVVMKFRDLVRLHILYAEPEKYFPQREEYLANEKGLIESACVAGDPSSPHEYGVDEVEINGLYPGIEIENRPEYVVAVPSLRANRLRRCLQHRSDAPLTEPEKHIYWILGTPPSQELLWREELQRKVIQHTMSEMSGVTDPARAPRLVTGNSTSCSTRDYRAILKTLIEVSDRKRGYNISLVHMGSKLQGIGLGLALSVRTEIAVCLARPTSFNASKYSSGVGSLWKIVFDDLDTVWKKLSLIGTLTLVPKIETAHSGRPSD